MSYPTQDEIAKVLDLIEKGRIKATRLIPPNAPLPDQVKFALCQKMLKFKRVHGYSNKELASLIGVTPAVVTRILHCHIERFKIDSLLSYYECLLLSLKSKKAISEFKKELAGLLNKAA